MEEVLNQNNKNNAKVNIKAFFYTVVIFILIVLIWAYTNPLFKKKEIKNENQILEQGVVEKANSIGESFKTMWSTMSGGIKKLK